MSSVAINFEDWIRECVRRGGQDGQVYLPCNIMLGIADWIEAHKDAVPVVRCKDCKWQDKGENDSESWNICMYRPWSYKQIEDTDFCSDGKRRDDDSINK